ncbi:MAG: SUMF1/EgtB/PvdO family nonheme iron enzyme [Planctomycetes bacterium]|nr:SUMF1/EgtB/PvdO family nonheme iron enzyme [Planctomycetota bacterium]
MGLLILLLLQEPPDGMVYVPAAEFTMGSDDGGYDEAPAHRVRVSSFYIDRSEVTIGAFAEFVRRTRSYDSIEGFWFRYSPQGCRDILAHCDPNAPRRRAAEAALRAMTGAERDDLPVRGVTWRDAAAYAKWAGKRLPTEAEWELAARGTDGRKYPWGPTWDAKRCRAGLDADAGPLAVGSFRDGASPFGCLDMAGNVWEWTADWYGERYYAESKGATDPRGPEGLADGRLPGPTPGVDLLRSPKQGRESNTRKVLRGGGWAGTMTGQGAFLSRATTRSWSNPSYAHPDVGFRCVKDAR